MSENRDGEMMLRFSILILILWTAPVLAQPTAPNGFRWEVIESLTDEFEGAKLNADKWHDHNPSWVGRPPGKFMPSSVSLKDGNLSIQCKPLEPADGKFTVASGTVQAKQTASYGYYECRMKASKLSASSNFWFVSDAIDTPQGKQGLELIVQFTIGKSEQHNRFMKSNAMVSLKKPGNDTKREKAKVTDRVELKSSVSDEFHTYGCWWVDANTLKFYVDGEYAYTLNPSKKFGDEPFRYPLKMTLVCETFDWQPLPTIEELSDDTKNTALFDYVRSYRLVKDNFKHLFGAKLMLRRLQQLDLTDQQLESFDKLSRQYKAEVLAIREVAGIEKADIAERDKVYRVLSKTDLKGDEFWLQLQQDGKFTDQQRIGFQKTKERAIQFKKDVLTLLTDEQRKRWGSTGPGKRSSKKHGQMKKGALSSIQELAGLVGKSKLIFGDRFDRIEIDDAEEELGPGWVTNTKTSQNPGGEKQADLLDGFLRITKAKAANHGVSVRHDNPFKDGIVMAKFRLHDNEGVGFHFNDPACKVSSAGHICRVGVAPNKLDFRDGKTGQFNQEIRELKRNGAPKEQIAKLMEGTKKDCQVNLELGRWYELVFLIQGDQVKAWIDGEKVGEFRSPGIDHPTKQNIALSVWGDKADVDELRVWSLSH